jgi:hypothetical protein
MENKKRRVNSIEHGAAVEFGGFAPKRWGGSFD